MLPRLIGIVGFAQAGKDSVAAVLERDFGYTKLGFADALREMMLALNPYVLTANGPAIYSHLLASRGYEDVKKESDVRRLFQRLGTEAGRKVLGNDIWVDTAMKRAARHERVAFSDCRFPNEADAVKMAGGVIVRVNRPGVGPVNDHESEHFAATVMPDFEIFNSGTLTDLSAQVAAIL